MICAATEPTYFERWSLLGDLPASDVSTAQVCLLQWLLHYTGDNPTCWPSRETLAGKCKMSVRQVQRHLNHLRGLGLISWRHSGFHGVNEYTLEWSEISRLAGVTSAEAPVTPEVEGVTPEPPTVTSASPSECHGCHTEHKENTHPDNTQENPLGNTNRISGGALQDSVEGYGESKIPAPDRECASARERLKTNPTGVLNEFVRQKPPKGADLSQRLAHQRDQLRAWAARRGQGVERRSDPPIVPAADLMPNHDTAVDVRCRDVASGSDVVVRALLEVDTQSG